MTDRIPEKVFDHEKMVSLLVSLAVYAQGVITVARVELELDFWFSDDLPACSVLWLLGDLQHDVVPALARIGTGLAPVRCGVACCVPSPRRPLLAGLARAELLLAASVDFAGRALTGLV